MKGLILKDFYTLISYCKINLIVSPFLILAGVVDDTEFTLLWGLMILNLLPITLLAYNEKEKWYEYCDTLPVTRADMVSSIYIISGCIWAASAVICIIAVIARALIGGVAVDYKVIMDGLDLAKSTSVTTGFTAICLPVLYKFGVEKGRIISILAVGALFGLLALKSGNTINLSVYAPLVALLFFGASWIISDKIFSHKEL